MSGVAVLAIGLALGLVAAWSVAAVLLPLWSRIVARRPDLARRSVVVAALPLLIGAALALAALLPGDPHLDQVLGCHCADSMPGWLHLCPLHPERSFGLVLPALVALALLLPGRLRAIGELLREPLGHGGGAEPTLLDLPRPVALLHGWARPSLVVDRGLWGALSDPERAAVLAHERGHLRRRDPLTLMLLRALVIVGPQPAARAFVRSWLDHAERMADASAASDVGDPLLVAEALVRCARVGEHRRLVIGWTGGRLEQRVEALLKAPAADPRPDVGAPDLLALAVAALGVLCATPWLHHQLEHVLNLSF